LSRVESLLSDILAFVQLLIYVAVSYAVLKSHRAALKSAYSALEKINLSWLSLVLSGLLVVWSLEVAEYVIWFATGDTRVVALYYLAQIVFLGFLILLFFRGLRQPEVFSGSQEDNHGEKYGKALLSEAQKELYAQKLRSFMELEKPYLDPLLSLGQLSKKAAIPSHHLSQVLNTRFHQNFFDFVNSYRIKESQRLLIDPNNGKRTILAVVYETGFNSKSVFNSAFKKHTGMTPSEFRKQQT
jgi:AraC-like DNA-binding protein